MAQINWEEGQKFKCITPATWALKVFVFSFARAREMPKFPSHSTLEPRVSRRSSEAGPDSQQLRGRRRYAHRGPAEHGMAKVGQCGKGCVSGYAIEGHGQEARKAKQG